MSAPPLPEVFGNYALGDFVEVVAPGAISWLPQTSGWLWLGAALLALSLRHGYRRLWHWYNNRYRREAIARLELLAEATDQGIFLFELNRLLKLTALAAFSREQVARLQGAPWVEFLNQQCAAAPFNEEQGWLLAVGVYRNTRFDRDTRAQLLGASRTWIVEHVSTAHV